MWGIEEEETNKTPGGSGLLENSFARGYSERALLLRYACYQGRAAYKFKGDISNVVLVSKDFRALVAIEGVPTGAAHKRLFDAIKAEVGAQ
jgi:hypothetical protein